MTRICICGSIFHVIGGTDRLTEINSVDEFKVALTIYLGTLVGEKCLFASGVGEYVEGF